MHIPFIQGCTVAYAISCKSIGVEIPVRSQTSPCGICTRQSGDRTGFPPSPSVFPCRYYSSTSPYCYFVDVSPKVRNNSFTVCLCLLIIEEMLPKSCVPILCRRPWRCLCFLASFHCRSLFVTSRTHRTRKQEDSFISAESERTLDITVRCSNGSSLELRLPQGYRTVAAVRSYWCTNKYAKYCPGIFLK